VDLVSEPETSPARTGRSNAWAARLRVDGRDVAPAVVALHGPARRRGLLGRDGIAGAFLLPATSVHTLGMRFALDVAFCRAGPEGSGWIVEAVRPMPPGRISRPRLRARWVVEAQAGAFEQWGLRPGAAITITPTRRPDRPRGAGPEV
jgi:uncharacterized membrane protein (UPF0127 family)